MITKEIINFLEKIPPYKFLKESLIEKIAENLLMEFFPRDTYILTQDGPPSDSLRIIRKGGVKVFLSNDDEIVIDYKSVGDSFGYISLVSGDRSRTNVLAIEDTLCYMVPKEVAIEVAKEDSLFGEYFMKSFFNNYLDRTYKEMKEKNLLFKEGEKLLYTSSVGTIASKEAVSASPGISIREAAGIMSQKRISSLILSDSDNVPVGIVTDRDFRDKVVARGMDLTDPVSNIMSRDLVTIDSGESCFNALAVMISNNLHHLLVTERERIKGIVTNHDFMLMQGTSPLSLLKYIDRQDSLEDIADINRKINHTISILFTEGVKAVNILRIITELHDRLIRKVIHLSFRESGEPPFPFTFFVFGSEGRKEETFKAVSRCAIAYEDNRTEGQKLEMDGYCQQFLVNLRAIFEKCGLPLFDISPLGSDTALYRDVSAWADIIMKSLTSSDNGYSAAKKMLDMRALYGNDSLVRELKDRLYRDLTDRDMPELIMPASEIAQRPPVGFLNRFSVDKSGALAEELDIKESGIIQIVDAVRALAVLHGIDETSTLDRLDLLSGKGFLADMKRDIKSAFEFMLHMLLQSQLLKKEMDLEIDNMVETEKLSILEKKTLKEVFQIIQELQESVKNLFNQESEMVR